MARPYNFEYSIQSVNYINKQSINNTQFGKIRSKFKKQGENNEKMYTN